MTVQYSDSTRVREHASVKLLLQSSSLDFESGGFSASLINMRKQVADDSN